MESSSLYPLRDGGSTRQRARRRRPQHGIVTMWYAAVCRVDITRDGGFSEPGDGDLSPSNSPSASFVLHSFVVLSRFPAVPLFLGYVVYALLGTGLFWQYGRIVATRYGSIDGTTATQLLINSTRFSLLGTLENRDIGTPS